jgi:hypothetical protein
LKVAPPAVVTPPPPADSRAWPGSFGSC